MKSAAIIQSNYLPWKGYFHMIQRVDVFVFLEDVQYTIRDWRNRNRIKVPEGGSKWITVPVLGGRDQLICEARIDSSRDWGRQHLEALRRSYSETPGFSTYFPDLKSRIENPPELLSQLNRELVGLICSWLGIQTEFIDSSELRIPGSKDDKLLGILKEIGADHYLSGPAARDYIVREKFDENGVGLEFMDYSNYSEYPQISPPFEHGVTILDLLFMKGGKAPESIWAS